MTIVRDWNTANGVIRIALGNGTVPMDRTSAFVADPSHTNATNREVGGSNGDYATAVTRRIVQTNDIAHDYLSVSLPTSSDNGTLFISEGVYGYASPGKCLPASRQSFVIFVSASGK